MTSRRFVMSFVIPGALFLLPYSAVPEDRPSISATPDDEARLREELKAFRYRGKPIPPAAVAELGGILADPLPTLTSIDLEGWLRSNRAVNAVTERNGWIESDLVEDGKKTGYNRYRREGTLAGDVHVLQAVENGGGTGAFKDLLLVRFEFDDAFENGFTRRRISMRRVGGYSLGDRDDGKVDIHDGKIIIGASRYRPESVAVTVPELR